MPTDPARAEEVAAAARLIHDPAERAAYLDRACDAGLRAEVDALLAPAADTRTALLEPRDEGATGAYRPDDPTETFTAPPAPAGPALSGAETGAFGPDPSGGETGTFDPAVATPPHRGGAVPGVIGGKYQIVSVIGEGGMGSVYLARQTEPIKREVALKLIKRGADSRAVVARFEAERQALALMDHPNIARVYDGGTTPTGQPYFVMELVRGVPVTKYCDDHRLSPTDRLELFVQVCRAVQHAHQKGIIHRDLKPGNILVTPVDGRPVIKVIDFGVAKAVDQRLTDDSFSDEGAIVGTPAYMSPEQTNPGEVDVDTRADVYALGVVLYELLAGSPPISPKSFRRGAILEMLRMVREVEPDHLSTKASTADALPNIAASRGLEPAQLLSFLRGDIDWIALKALEKDRERRYESANEMAADIQRYLAHQPVVARPPSRGYRLRKFVRRNRGAVAAAAVVAVALLAGAAGVTWQWREAVFQRKQADQARADAEANFRVAQVQRKVALEAVGQMVTKVRTELVKRPDLQGVLKEVLRIVQGSLDNIAQNPLVDVSLNDTTRAAAHDAAARLHRDLGDTPAALKEFNTAADIYRAILEKAADGPDKEVVKKNLVITLISIGQTSLRTGSQADARQYYDQAAELLGRADNTTAADFRKLLVNLYQSIGAVTTDRKPREARENYLGALRVAEELAKEEGSGGPSDETRLTLQKLYSLLGQAETQVRQPKAGEGYYSKARAIADARLKDRADDTARKRDAAHVAERIGDLLLRTGKPAEAAREYAAAAKLAGEVASADPKNVDAQADHARIRYSQGLAAVRAGDAAGAGPFFRQSLDIRKGRPNLATETVAQRDLMMSLAQTGGHREAVEMAEAVRAKLPKDPGALVDIACCYAVCAAAAPAGPDRERYAGKALEALGQAVDAGYGDKVNLETEPDLDGVRGRAEFKAVVDRVPEP